MENTTILTYMTSRDLDCSSRVLAVADRFRDWWGPCHPPDAIIFQQKRKILLCDDIFDD
ncbi:hypothetical protein MTR_5g034800 [Medicago truncatula]|uniref:Uncharacterized protein n=1 Tax=Medicago truncatula TaxID=3880 RepID=G7K2Q6_MEDTR|nr:hypothetical protein MTR_5g034800 [Medicago truncatula]